jgi:hypothetical protein
MSFLLALSFALITAAGSNIGMIVQSIDKDTAKVVCLLAMFVCIICCTVTISLVYWILPQLAPRKTDDATDELIDQFIEFKNAVYDRLEAEEKEEFKDVKEL